MAKTFLKDIHIRGKGLDALMGDPIEEMEQPKPFPIQDKPIEVEQPSTIQKKPIVNLDESNSDEVKKKVKTTVYLSADHLKKIKAFSFWHHCSDANILAEALDRYFDGMDEEQFERVMKTFEDKKR